MNDDELLARLQAADPASRAPVPPNRWIDALTEATMTDHERATPQPSRWGWLVAVAAGILIAGIGGYAWVSRDQPAAPVAVAPVPLTITELEAPAQVYAKCMVPSADTLATAQTAFDGSVVSIEGDQVTLDVDTWYAGEATDRVVVTSPPDDQRMLLAGVDFQPGRRYLVAASDGQVMVCGFSAAYDKSLAGLYAEAFPG